MLQQIVQSVTKTKEDYVATFTKDCCDTEFNINSARQQNAIATKKESVTTLDPYYCEKICHDRGN